MMKITVKLFATLRDYGPEIQEISIPADSTVENATKLLNLPKEIPLLTIVNGIHAIPEDTLKEGDTLALFPPIGGG